MIKKALEYLNSLSSENKIEEIHNQKYSIKSLQHIKEVSAQSLRCSTLSALVSYLKENPDKIKDTLSISIGNPTSVSVFSSLKSDLTRNLYIAADANLPRIQLNSFTDLENFNISLQSCFVDSDFRKDLLKVLSNVVENESMNTADDGISQKLQAKTGIATIENVTIENPIALIPYRTFTEVTQPESKFILRLRKGPSAALFEADGGAWEVEAIKNIKEYLEENLKELPEGLKVVILN